MSFLFNSILSTFILQIKYTFARPMFKFILFVTPLAYSVITYTLFSHSNQKNFAAYAIIGTGLLALWDSICFSSAGDIDRERRAGTLQAVYNTPTKFKLLIIGKILGNTCLGVIPFVVSFFVIRFGYGVKVYIAAIPQFVFVFLISILSFISVAFFFAALFTLSRSASILMNFLGAPIHILCGIAFPISLLPSWTRPLSYILPPTWAAELLRMCVDGIIEKNLFLFYSGILIVEFIIYIIVSFWLFEYVDKLVRINASITIG